MIVPRNPTRREIEQLAQAQIDQFGCPEADAMDAVLCLANVAVFDDYVTDSPGYCGKVMLVVWDCGPSAYEAYIWDREDNLHYLPQNLSYKYL